MLSRILLLIFLFIGLLKPDTVSDYCEEAAKQCLIREDHVYDTIWNYYAGYWCYFYSNTLTSRYPYGTTPITCKGELISVYGLKIDENGTVLLIDFTNETSMWYIKNQFRDDSAYQLFLNCNRDSVNCCQNQMTNDNVKSNKTHCPVIWDAWSCFPQTKVNTSASQPCSQQYYATSSDVCTLESRKECLWNEEAQLAEWNGKSDYSPCLLQPLYAGRYNFHILSLSVCIGLCFPAIVIFLIFENLRSTVRVILHRNLLMAICLRCIFTIISKKLIFLDSIKPASESYGRLNQNGVGCRMLTFLESSSINCIYGCMLLDAFYLHKVIVRAFAKEVQMKYIYAVLVVLTFGFSITWSIMLYIYGIENCWLASNNMQWIMDGYRISVLFINTLLLADIIRVMLLKLKRGSTTKQTMAALRATIFLIPLFGLHIIVTAKKIVYDNSCTAEDVYDYARYTMEGLQGIIVSVIFCYANNEVQGEIKNGMRKTCINLNQKFGWNIGGIRSYDKRRVTTATLVPDAN